jgi:autotransporter-associated beta strand protein
MRCSRQKGLVLRASLAALPASLALTATVAYGQTGWNGPVSWTANLIVSGNDNSVDLKNPQLVPAQGGGFHLAYIRPGASDIRYKRINSSLAVPANSAQVWSGSFLANPNVAEMNDGTVRLGWEQWSSGPEVGTRRINNDGTFIAGENPTVISNSGLHAKFPLLSSFGTANDSRAVMSYWNSSSKDMRYQVNNGSSWGADTDTGYNIENEYLVTGMAKSPMDGSVWRAYGVKTSSSPNTYALRMINFNPNTQTWSAPIDVQTGITTFPSRIQMAANWHGRVLVAWDGGNNDVKANIYTPGQGFMPTPLQDTKRAFWGNVAAVPGTPNDWWLFNDGYGKFPMARPIVNGVMDGAVYVAEYPSASYPSGTQFFNGRGAVDAMGHVSYVYEYWLPNSAPIIGMSTRTALSYQEGVWLGGGNGNWSDASRWAGMVVPDTSSVNVRLDYGSPASSNSALDQNATVGSLQLDVGDSLSINSGKFLTISGPSPSNLAGTLNNAGSLAVSGSTVTITGSGTHSGLFTTGSTGALNFAGGTHNLTNATNSFSGVGPVTFSGGNITVSKLGVTGTATLAGATLNATTLTVNASRTFNYNSGSLTVATVTNSGTINLGANNLSATTINLTGGTINSTTGTVAAATLAAQSGTINPAVVGATSLTKTGSGAVTLNSTNTFTGGTTVQAGTLVMNRLQASNAVTISGGTLRVMESLPGLGSGHPSGNNAFVSRPSSLNISGTGTLDLNNNDLILDYSGGSPIGVIEDWVAQGFHGGDFLGTGITSTTAANGGGAYVLAIADNAQLSSPFGTANGGPLFSGVDVDLTSVLIKFTHRVDLNFDGVISDADSIVFSTNFEAGAEGYWAIGDLNYDGVLTSDDATIFSTYYETGLASLPEPASALGLLATAGLTLLRSRRDDVRSGR